MGIILLCTVVPAIFLFWGLLGAAACKLVGDDKGAWNLVETGAGFACLTPIAVFVGAILMALML